MRFVFLILLGGCAASVPVVRVAPSRALPALALEVCRLDGEVHHRSQWAAISDVSFDAWDQVIGSVVVKHPRGVLVIDPAFGEAIAGDMRQAPTWFRLMMGDGYGKRPVVQLMEEEGVDARDVRPSRLAAHGGVAVAGGVRVRPHAEGAPRSRSGAADVRDCGRPVRAVQVRRRPARWLSELARSVRRRQRGRASPARPHAGSTGYLVQGRTQRWLFIGDAAWSSEGVSRPASKDGILSAAVDCDADATAQTLGVLHLLQKVRPDIQIVPAHDLAAMQSVPACESSTTARE